MSATLTLLALGGPAGDAFAAAAGVAAAVLLLGGPIALRAQRQRHQFLLTRAALEHGVTQLPPGPPAWLQSARTGWVLLTLGIALLICGGVAVGLSNGVPVPEKAAAATQPMMAAPVPPEEAMPPMDQPPRGLADRGPNDRGRGDFDGPPGERFRHPGPPTPPPFDPVVEQWHQARAEHAIGLTALACGFILSVMGCSRLLFSRVERRYEPTLVDQIPPK